jgi:hypothetical protein
MDEPKMMDIDTLVGRLIDLEGKYYELQSKYQTLIHQYEELKASHEDSTGQCNKVLDIEEKIE